MEEPCEVTGTLYLKAFCDLKTMRMFFLLDDGRKIFYPSVLVVKISFAETIATFEDKLEEYICQRFLIETQNGGRKPLPPF